MAISDNDSVPRWKAKLLFDLRPSRASAHMLAYVCLNDQHPGEAFVQRRKAAGPDCFMSQFSYTNKLHAHVQNFTRSF